MIKSSTSLAVILTLTFFIPCIALGEPISCPTLTSVTEKVTSNSPEWELNFNTLQNRVAQITIFDGPPSEKVALKHDGNRSKNGKKTLLWRFYLPHTAASTHGYWISCAYTHTNATMSKRLPDSVKECAITYTINARVENDFLINKVECK